MFNPEITKGEWHYLKNEQAEDGERMPMFIAREDGSESVRMIMHFGVNDEKTTNCCGEYPDNGDAKAIKAVPELLAVYKSASSLVDSINEFGEDSDAWSEHFDSLVDSILALEKRHCK